VHRSLQTVAFAYIGYYTAEVVWGFSGVISTVVTGVMVSFFGRSMINDPKLLDDFWVLLEHLLNTSKLRFIDSFPPYVWWTKASRWNRFALIQSFSHLEALFG